MLTSRRKQFLEKIQELYARTGKPVHYVDLANALGVSKWTAYDLVKALAADGHVGFKYMKPEGSGQVGRSRLGVVPVFARNTTEKTPGMCEEMAATKSSLLEMLADGTALGKKGFALELIKRSQHVKSREMIFIYLLVATLVLLRKHSQFSAIVWLNSLVGAASVDLLVGGALGLALGMIFDSSNLKDRMDREVCDALKKRLETLQSVVTEFSEKEKRGIRNFWVEVMAVLPAQ